MSNVLVLYATGEGQTAKVAELVAETIRREGHEVHRYDVHHAPADLDPTRFDALVLGCSIHAGKHDARLLAWARKHRFLLTTKPSAFFSVSLTAAQGDPESRATVQGYVEELRKATGWDPDLVGVFGGALAYTRYGFVKRALMRRIAASQGQPTDTSHDVEYTDWDAVEAFARDVATQAAAPAF